MKKLKEVRERANNLAKQNEVLEDRIKEFEKLVENQDIENWEIRERHSHASLNYMQKIEKMKEVEKWKEFATENQLKENLKDRNEEL